MCIAWRRQLHVAGHTVISDVQKCQRQIQPVRLQKPACWFVGDCGNSVDIPQPCEFTLPEILPFRRTVLSFRTQSQRRDLTIDTVAACHGSSVEIQPASPVEQAGFEVIRNLKTRNGRDNRNDKQERSPRQEKVVIPIYIFAIRQIGKADKDKRRCGCEQREQGRLKKHARRIRAEQQAEQGNAQTQVQQR